MHICLCINIGGVRGSPAIVHGLPREEAQEIGGPSTEPNHELLREARGVLQEKTIIHSSVSWILGGSY